MEPLLQPSSHTTGKGLLVKINEPLFWKMFKCFIAWNMSLQSCYLVVISQVSHTLAAFTARFLWFPSVPPGECWDRLGHNRFPPHSFHFIIHLSPFHLTIVCVTKKVIK
jgi:hypothetical protein